MQTNLQMDGQTLCEGATKYHDNNERFACYLPHYVWSDSKNNDFGIVQVDETFVTYRPRE